MGKDSNKNIGRREFIKLVGLGSLASFAACKSSSEKSVNQDDEVHKGEMTYRTNHNSGDKTSILGYGMMRLPTTKIEDGINQKEVIDQERVNELVDYAMAHGVNYYDTAPVYCQGKSEEATGIALSRYPRDSYYIATKLSNFSPDSQTRDVSIQMFENSLKYLQTSYVDYLLLHAIGGGGMPNFNARYIDNGILEYLKQQKEEGRIRNLGFSFHGEAEVFDTMMEWMDQGKIHWDFVQIQLNYMDWNGDKLPEHRNVDAEYLYNELKKRDIPAVIMEPLLGGRLANVSEPVAAKMKQRKPDDSIASWAFRFAGSHNQVLTVLSGMTYMEHLQDNLKTYSPLEILSEEEMEFLQRCAWEIQKNKTIPCTACQYCMPCPYGLNIPEIFAFYNKCINEDNMPRDSRDPHYAKARKAFLLGMDRAVPKERQAHHCINCGACLPECPQSINIPKQMRKIEDYTNELKAGKA